MRRLITLTAFAVILFGQENPSWWRPYPAHTIAGNLHYVGTEDLACFLLTSPQGHILINTGMADSTPLIRESMQKLGFRLEDIKILLTMQAHGDHVEAMREIQQLSGAKVYATEADAPALEDGGKSDPVFGDRMSFAPVKVDRLLKDGDVIALGSTQLKVILTPGHSKGSVSYSTTVEDGGKKRDVLIANMGSVVMPLAGNTRYPQIVEDLARSFDKQRKLSPEIWVAAHASQYHMARKHKAGSFVDPEGYKRAIDHYEQLFRKRLAEEKAGRSSR
jgi:metallo-beta-lactamase class B